MGAFLLTKEGLSRARIQDGLNIFKAKGFDKPKEFLLGDYRLFLYQKQMVATMNVRKNENIILASIGTPIYKNKSYNETLDLILDDLKFGKFDYSKIYGTYILIYYDGIRVHFIFDDMRQLPIYSSDDRKIISSSFLACAKAYDGFLTVDKMACLEKLCTGMIIGESTLFNEIKKVLQDDLSSFEILTRRHKLLKGKRKGYSLKTEAKRQLQHLETGLDKIASLVGKYGADMGVSGGYDSRLIYGLLAQKYGNMLSIHTHCTEGAHEKEIEIARQLAQLFGKDLHMKSTIPLQNMDSIDLEETLKTNMYLFDGYSDSHYGTFSSTYSKRYREDVSDGRMVFFTGISGEIYRNYRKISKPVFTKKFFDVYVFYCHYKKAINNSQFANKLRQYVIQKAFAEMDTANVSVMSPSTVRRYNACVRLPYKASCAATAFNQLCFYDAPCTHRDVVQESMEADHTVGDDARLEAEMIRLIDERLWSVPITKVDSTKIGDKSLITNIKKYIYARLPMSFIKRRKLKSNKTTIGERIIAKADQLKEAICYSNEILGDMISFDSLIQNKNSYQNTIFFCRTLYEFKDKMA